MFRQQLHGVKILKAIQQIRKEGLTHIYRGLLPSLLQKTTSMSLMFGLYYDFQRQIYHYNLFTPMFVVKPSATMLTGSVEALLSPFEHMQVLMQDRSYHAQYNNTAHAFKNIYLTYGVKEFYRGLSTILIRNGPSNVLFFLERDNLLETYAGIESTGGWRIQAYAADLLLNIKGEKLQLKKSAGFDTTHKKIRWLVLYMAAYPAVQGCVQEVIDSVVGQNRPPVPQISPALYTQKQ
ncbi:S2551-like protein [Mya arenaria]|uniref:S2551-like protein n=1 Tax=Mya arenaria TaxID=6604 RepID=A0ABY7DRT1_MYAAR|nr:S2551-like protein [Mya arenaria]